MRDVLPGGVLSFIFSSYIGLGALSTAPPPPKKKKKSGISRTAKKNIWIFCNPKQYPDSDSVYLP